MDHPNCFGQLYEDTAQECKTCEVAADCKEAQFGDATEAVEEQPAPEAAATAPAVEETPGLDEKLKDLDDASAAQEQPAPEQVKPEPPAAVLPATEHVAASGGLEYRKVVDDLLAAGPQGKDALIKASEPLVQNAKSKVTNYLRKLKTDGTLRDAPHPSDKRAKVYYTTATPTEVVDAFFATAAGEPAEPSTPAEQAPEPPAPEAPEPEAAPAVTEQPEPQVTADGKKVYIDNFLTKRIFSLPYGDKRGCEVEVELETQDILSNSAAILDGVMSLAGQPMQTLEDVAKAVKYKIVELVPEGSRVRSVRAYTEKTQVRLF